MKKLLVNIFFLLMTILPLCASADGVSVFGNYLYWNASEQTSSVWANEIGVPHADEITYTLPNVKFNWSSGFRGGIAYESPHFWDTKLYWTHLPTNKNLSITANNSIITPQFFSGYLSKDFFSSDSTNWKIIMNTIDFEISHKINLTPSLIISPKIGVKGAIINQTIDSDLSNIFFSSTETVENDFSGVGPSFGVDGKWNFYKDFSFLANFSTALMWGRWNVNDTYTRPSAFFGLISPTTITSSMNNTKLGTTMFQYFLGMEWTKHQPNYQVTAQLGYEMQYWPYQLRALAFQEFPLHGDLTLQGVTCGISVGF